jgi:hypothetical protein
MSSNGSEHRSGNYEQESDTIQRFFRRPFFLSLTIGIPFCIFKLLFGVSAVRIGSFSHPLLTLFGWCVVRGRAPIS